MLLLIIIIIISVTILTSIDLLVGSDMVSENIENFIPFCSKELFNEANPIVIHSLIIIIIFFLHFPTNHYFLLETDP